MMNRVRVCYIISGIAPDDFTRSHREDNEELYISAVGKALLVFAFDKTHYQRWDSVFYEDYLQLFESFLAIHADIQKGRFVVKQTSRKFSRVPIDHVWEQTCNNPAKGRESII